jgi:hypothetical protein
VWALLGPHRGDNNQILALANALGLPFEEKILNCDKLIALAEALSWPYKTKRLTGKPVGMIPIRRSLRGQADHLFRKCGWNLPSNADLSRFWRYLASNNLVGGVDSRSLRMCATPSRRRRTR